MLSVNTGYQQQPDVGNFKGPPSIILNGIEGVRAALSDTSWLHQPHPFRWRVKSDWLIALIDEIEASGAYPYNADVHRLARERLGLPALSERENAQEGSPLSNLIYNAQQFRRSDRLRASGFEPLTEDVLKGAFVEKRKVETTDGTRCTVRLSGERLYAFKPRKRKYALAHGTPVRIV